MKIKKYGDAASEYSTRGKDPSKVNKEFSDIMKTMRTGLQTYKKTLGVNPKKEVLNLNNKMHFKLKKFSFFI